jgi:hypothetical protein
MRWSSGRIPGRIRRAACHEPKAWRVTTLRARRRSQRSWLRPSSPGHGSDAGGGRRAGLSGAARHRGPGSLLWVSRRGTRRRQVVHGQGGRFSRHRSCPDLAPRPVLRHLQVQVTCRDPSLFPVHRPGVPRRGVPTSRSERAGRRRADECRHQFPARAYAARGAYSLRHHRRRRTCAQRGPGQSRCSVPRPCAARRGSRDLFERVKQSARELP